MTVKNNVADKIEIGEHDTNALYINYLVWKREVKK